MSTSRSEKVVKNVFFGILAEAIKLACGLILPRLILSNFGSAYNGIVQSISQFLTCIALMKTGIGGATRAALFKPLAEKDDREISEVVASTESFMRKVALIFVVFVLVFASIYPIYINTEFDWLFSFSLIIIISFSTFAEYYFGFTYGMLVIADQKGYITELLSILGIILNTIVSVILINNNFSIHIVKLGSSLVSIIAPIFLYVYCHRKYHLIKIKKPKANKIPQRWDAFTHEIASFVNDNTDIMILTFFTNLLEVSVYTVYHYVIVNIKKIMSSFVAGFGSAFGDMYAKDEKKALIKNLEIYEFITFSFTSVIYSTTLVMIVPFALLYTKGICDVNYNRLVFAIILTLAGTFDCFRYPYKQIINNTGNYKQTKHIAVIEAIMNITISIIMVSKYGLVGVAIGTLCTMIFGAIMYSYYLSKNIIIRNPLLSYKHMLTSLLVVISVYLISNIYVSNISNYYYWILYAFITTIISICVTLLMDFLFYRDSMNDAFEKIIKIIRKNNN